MKEIDYVPDAVARSVHPARQHASRNCCHIKDINRNLWHGLLVLFLSTLACRPVIAIGWNEFLFLFVLIAVLLGPPLYKFLRRVEEFWKRKPKDK